ncbi:MAG TPA: glycosyltransferase family 4 protein [Pyrinomonadaceae bacterium]|jgi:glycosyltransferase involved in cell wall biosynthesis|nr:glycosyltransferase family 4 protein [Pyrinomonadaceae bacterium]
MVATTEGGTWMFEQLRELRNKHGFEVAAIVSGDRGRLIDKLRSENIPFHVFDFRPGFGSPRALFELPLAVLRLARLLRRERFDVVQTHIFATMMLGRPAAWLADVPVRLAMIAGPFQLEAPTCRWIDRATWWMETTLIAACEKSVELCREIGVRKDRLCLIYYTPDEQKFDPAKTRRAKIREQFGWAPDTPVIGMIAYFYPRLLKSGWIPDYAQNRGVKGHEDLINAAVIVLKRFPNAKFLLVGSGWTAAGDQYQEEMKTMVRKLGLEDSVIFTGFHENVNGVLRELDIAVQASISENLGGTVEALLMERPLVATRVGGMVDTVKDGETGLLVNPSDPDDLARAVIQLLGDPQRASASGVAGRKLMLERFTLAHTASQLAELYERLLTRENGRRRFYSPLVFGCRLVLAAPVFAYVAFRFFVIDIFVPIYLPDYLAVTRGLLIRACYLPVRVFYYALTIAVRAWKSIRPNKTSLLTPSELDELGKE